LQIDNAHWLGSVVGVALSDNVFMPMQIAAGETDDPQFITLLNSLVRGLIREDTPQELWIIQIDNWFDHKWLRYQDKLTFPPFTPNRVLGQWSFVRIDDHYAEAPLRVLPHPSEKRASETKLHRRVDGFSGSACFLWYSAKTLANGRASVMVYSVAGERIEAWFAAFNRRQGWKLQATKCASRDDVQQLIDEHDIAL
jgi:hypothetical protein